MSDNVDLLKQIVTTVQKKNDKEQVNDTIKTKPAKVIGVDDETHKVFVYFLEDTEQKEYTFYNKSGEILSEGDTVKVFYTTNVAKGWIGARNGEPSIKEYIGVGRPSEWDSTSEYFNCYSGDGQNIAGLKGSKGRYATAKGYGTTASGFTSSSEGNLTTASGSSSHSEGAFTQATGYTSHAEGYTTKATGDKSHAEGDSTSASGNASHAEGNNNQANSFCSHAEGGNNTITGDYGHAEGQFNTVTAMAAHAEGGGNTVSGWHSHGEGNNNTSSGMCSHSEGQNNTASSFCSHAEGYNCNSSERCSHAEGEETKATGGRSHAEGYLTKSLAECSHAEGQETEASGNCSHAEGYQTKSLANYSFAGGNNTTVDGFKASFGFGEGVIVSSNSPYGRFYIGSYNDYSSWNIIFAIGNGDSDSNRSNAFAVDHDGNVYCKSINGIPINSENSYTYTPYSISEAVESAKTIFEAVMGG